MRMIRISLVAVLAVAAVSALPSRADSALNAYLKLKGVKQGNIRGSVVTKGREGQIRLRNVSQEVVSPRDAATGQATGRRQHGPLRVTFELDSSTPLLFKALCDNEMLQEVVIEFTSTDGRAGQEQRYYTIRLENASIARMVQRADGDDMLVDVEFTFREIELTWADGGIMAQDSWDVRR